MNGWEIHIEGRVQGVGFRPLVYRLAQARGLVGQVSNGVDGLRIALCGSRLEAENLLEDILCGPPPAAIVTRAEIAPLTLAPCAEFSIVDSDLAGQPDLLLTPDLAMCPLCREELVAEGRRKDYAFTTCTNCGPRFSIIEALPYDRPRTSMADFKMCPDCLMEYNAPNDRRHYSQTNSCPNCAVELEMDGVATNEILNKVVKQWREGGIVAIKGIGGYLLTCAAGDSKAITTLRDRKHRPDKPLAIMVASAEAVEQYCEVRPCEREALEGPAAPIVLLPLKQGSDELAHNALVPGLDRIGVLLPYAPLFQLLLNAFGQPIVATSGNISGEPIVYESKVAREKLGQVADLILSHNRPILLPQDDSVLAFTKGGVPVFMRRSRGYAPTYLPENAAQFDQASILTFGADLKATFCLQHSSNVYLSQYLGDLSSYSVQQQFQTVQQRVGNILRSEPTEVLADLHPQFASRALAEAYAEKHHLPLRLVQHHEAHFAAVLLENDLLEAEETVLGVIWDGTGFGSDGQIWGGEFFRYQQASMTRVGQLSYFPHFAGDKMSREPRLSALAIGGAVSDLATVWTSKFSAKDLSNYQKMRASTKLSSSSMGRLFDAVACILGLADNQSYEGMAASYLEALARNGWELLDSLSPYKISLLEDGQIPAADLLLAVHLDTQAKNIRALRFHLTLVALIREMAEKQAVKKVAFSGGVFQNTLLVDLLEHELSKDFELYFHRNVSPNDECISLGQLAYYRLTQISETVKKEQHVFSNSW